MLERSIYKKIEWYLFNYFNIRREINEYRDEVLNSGRQLIEQGGGGISRHSDPTALKAIKLASNAEIEKYEKWIKVIEKVIEHFKGTEKGKLLQMRYFDEYAERYICNKLHIERTTYFTWKNEIVLYTAMLAIQYGLIKVDRIA
ncbi:prophage LambdaCh01, phage transcriptional regulator, RinA family [Carboxydothermus hydrogenoformans Z-2901]|uniref:Prophage LambdaCh01, phage transcriptional regulator, RinA family n=1 Tax=Carboxydothermus hydrogenoformans (strain ATCC BAA-161 / DSM 6008 / Z-2901) TaxID=246194 RepID=Q3ABI1_CARHZ|nr:prophage LambdaCh01, phage transcriptional regulator, RinA family [Carboxydothermus hydrogenoformans Z-2901]